jgi:hypothetical protein
MSEGSLKSEVATPELLWLFRLTALAWLFLHRMLRALATLGRDSIDALCFNDITELTYLLVFRLLLLRLESCSIHKVLEPISSGWL